MGRLMGEYNKRSPRSTSSKHRVINQEEIEPTFNGELPLFFPTTKSSSFRDLKQLEVGWPLGSPEIAAWANSFRFELDSKEAERLQEALDATDRRSGRKLTKSTSSSSAGESFRFVSGNQSGYLKPPRQLEKHHHSKQVGDAASLSVRRVKVVADDVAASPRRSEILRRLRDLKAHPLSPRLAPEEDAVSYRREMAAVRDELHGRLKSSLPLLKDYSSSSPGHGELEITPNFRERRRPGNSPSGLRASPRKPAQEHPITSRFRNGDEQQSTTPTSRFRNADEQSTTPTSRFRSGDEQPTTPTSRSRNHLVSRRSIQEQIARIRKHPHVTMNSPSPEHALSLPGAIPFKWEEEPGKPKTEVSSSTVLKNDENLGKTGSFRFYGGHSREGSLGRSSRRYSVTQEPHIDLDASAAAKFLVFESPSRSPNLHSPRNFAVPFKWEATPGKSKVETVARSPGNLLQLPPRLAVPAYRISRELRGPHPFSGFFATCMTGSDISPVHRKMQYTPSKSLPPKAPSARRHGLVGRCSSAPREGCQIRVSRSFEEKPGSPGLKPRNLFISDSNGPSSPTSILCGPEESSSQTSTSHTAFSSGDLEDFRRQSVFKSSSSYESIEEEFTELSYSVSAPPPPPPPSDPQGASNPASVLDSSEQSSRRWKGRPDIVNSLLKPAAKLQNHAPENPSLALSNYFQSLELARSTEDVSHLQRALTSSSHPQQSSPRRATRLPYTMPSAAEQFLATCSTSGRRQLIQDLSPRLLHQYSGRRQSSGGNTPRVDKSKQEQQASSPSPAYAASLEVFSPAAAAVVPQRRKRPVIPGRAPLVPAPKPRRRSRFILSVCKNLKRVLLRRRRRNNPKEQPHPRLMYLHDGRSPSATLRFNKTYT